MLSHAGKAIPNLLLENLQKPFKNILYLCSIICLFCNVAIPTLRTTKLIKLHLTIKKDSSFCRLKL